MEKIVRKVLIISGYVQGVGFRSYCSYAAKMFKIGGYAKNLDSGKVEVLAEGDKKSLDSFYEFLLRGPGQIKKIEIVKSEEIKEKSKTFETN